MSFINIKNLTHKFYIKNDDGAKVESNTALDDISLNVERGEFVAILGHNGSGKSTLARHLNSLLFPYQGAVWVDNVQSESEDDPAIWEIRRNVGMVFQNPDNQIIGTTVGEDTAFGPENLGIESDQINKLVDKSLKSVEMEKYYLSSPNHLSGGQKQRVAIAGILAMHPKCIVLDEATAMLDPDGRKEIINTVKELHKNGMTVILITHFMEEAVCADKIFVMDAGKVILQGNPGEVFENVDIIKKAGLELPVATELAMRLRKDGFDMGKRILDKKEFADEFEKYYRSRL